MSDDIRFPPNLNAPPNMDSGSRHREARAERADKAAWVGLVSAFLLFGREISGRSTMDIDVDQTVGRAIRLYDEIAKACHAAPTRAF